MKKKKSSSSKRVKPIIWISSLVLVLATFILIVWHKLYPPILKDYTIISQEIDEVINQKLIEMGVSENDLLKKYQEERREGNITWILYTKEVRLPRSVFFPTCRNIIKRALKRVNAHIYNEKHNKIKNTLTLYIGKRSIPMQVLILSHRGESTPKKKQYSLSIIIDDVGYNKENIEKYIALGIPLTFAILPQEKFSRFLATRLKESGYETLLHLPLEPEGYPQINPGKGCLLLNGSFSKMKLILEKNLKSTPYIIGVNNHMGSLFTANKEKMRQLLSILKEKELFYVDSHTTGKSCASEVGKETTIEVLVSKMFLDNKDEYGYISEQLKKLKRIVLSEGSVVAIGHVQRKATPLVLKEYIPLFQEAGIEFVPISKMTKKGYLYAGARY